MAFSSLISYLCLLGIQFTYAFTVEKTQEKGKHMLAVIDQAVWYGMCLIYSQAADHKTNNVTINIKSVIAQRRVYKSRRKRILPSLLCANRALSLLTLKALSFEFIILME